MGKDQINNSLFNLNPLPSWIYDNETLEILDVNIAAIAHYEYTREEFLKFTLKDIRPAQEVPSLMSSQAVKKNNEGNNYIGIFTHQKKNGTLIQMEINGHKVNFNDRNCMLVVCQDVTEKIEQQEKIQQSEQRFKALVQEGSDLIGILDAEGNYKYVSPTSTSILGITPEEFIGRNAFEFIHPDDVEKTLASLQKITTENRVAVEPFRFQNHKKEWRWVETVLTNMMDNPNVNGIVANSRDITEWVDARKQLEANEQFNRTVLESSPDCLKVLDTDGRLQFMNFNGLCQMEIDDFSHFKNKKWWTLWGAENEALVKASLDKALKGVTAQFTAFSPTAKGTPKWWDVKVSPVGKAGEPVQQIISVSRDITELKTKELESELTAQISLNFAQENEYEKSIKELCATIGLFGKFDWVELWTCNMEKSQMQLINHFVSSPEDEVFYAISSELKALQKSEGIAGKVWAKGAQIQWNNIDVSNDFTGIRKKAAKKIGLKSVLSIPLFFNNEMLGVLNIGIKKESNFFNNYIRLFEQLEGFIGAELKRKILENDLSHLFDTIPDMISVGDFEGRFLRINKAGCELLGYHEDEILYHSFDEFIHPDDKENTSNEIKGLIEEGKTSAFENRYLTKTGAIVWLSWNCNSSLAEGLIYATAKNITEEKKLRELNRLAGSMAKIGSWEVDLIHSTSFWSDMTHHIHETNPSLYVPNLKEGIDFFREDFRPMINTLIQRSITTGESFDFEAVLVTANKKEKWIRAIGNAEMVNGKCQRLYGSFQDINSLKESENRLISISENLPGIVFQFLIQLDGTASLQYISGGVEQLWGFTDREVMEHINLIRDQVKLGGNYDEVRKSILNAIQTKSKWTCRFKYVLPTGELRTHLGIGSASFLTDGTILFNSIILDITQEAKNEELLELATELARIGSWEIDLVGNNIIWSDMVHKLHDTDPKTFEPDLETGINFYREDFREMVTEEVAKCVETGEGFDFEAILITAKKQERWVRAIGNAEIVEGKCQRIYGSFQDIDAIKKSEIKLAESENRFRTILDAEPECIKLLGPDDEVLMMNPAGLAMVDADNEVQIVGKSVLGIVLPEHRPAFSDLTKTVFKGGSGKLVFEIKGLKGTHRWMETHAVPLRNEQGDIISLLAVTRDITERKKAEEGIKDSEEKRRLIMSGALDAIICIDINETITFWNPRAEEIFGWKEEEVIGQLLSELIVPKPFRKYHTEGIKNYLKIGEGKAINVLLELSALNRSGAEFPIELTVIPIKQGEDLFFCAFIRDITQRKKTEKELTIAFEEKNSIVESIADAFFTMDRNFTVTYWNRAAEELIGVKRDQLIGKCLWDVFPDAVKLPSYTNYHKVLETGQPITFEDYYGTWLEINAYPSDEGITVLFRDISFRKEADERLLKAFEEKNNILESIGDAFFAVDENWIITYWNKEAESLIGRKREDLIGDNLWILFADAIDTDFYRQFHKAMETGEKTIVVDYYPAVSKWIEATVYPSNEGLSIYFKDVTLRKEADIRLLQANERFEKVTEATNDVIWDWDMVKQTQYRSKAIERLFGKDALTSRTPNDFWKEKFHPEDLAQLQHSFYEAIANPFCTRWESEYRIFNEHGEILYIIDRGVILRNSEGKAIRMVGAMTDITEQKHMTLQLNELNLSLQQQAEDLKRSNEELEQFAFVASHDLQEPLRMISSFMDQLKRKYAVQLDEKALQYIHFATDGAKRMKQIILDLLLYSRASRPSEVKENVDINEVLDEYKMLRRKLIAEKKASIIYIELPVLTTYKAAITQILHCLLDNAIKYSKEGTKPEVQIAAIELENEWKFSVKDNGIGIDPQFYEKIFIIFQRLHNMDAYSGTGIGLAVAKRHVEFLGGRIWLESAPGEGSTFYFTVPKQNF